MIIPRRPNSSDRSNRGPARQHKEKMKWAAVITTDCKRYGKVKRANRRIRVPAYMWPCTIEEKLTLKTINGEVVEEYETKVVDDQGFTTRYPGRCPKFLEDGEVGRAESRGLYAFVDRVPEEEERKREDDFASRLLPQREGNKNGWISEEEEEPEEEHEVDSDLESTATSRFNPTQE